MIDLDRRMRELDRTPVPDLWPDIEARTPRAESADGRSRLAAAMAAVVVAVAGIGAAWWALLPDQTVAPSGPSPTLTTRNGEIWFFSGGGDGPSWVYEIQPDGTGERKLFSDGRDPGDPPDVVKPEAVGEGYDWSPDGSRVAFAHHTEFDPARDGSQYEIFAMNPDGSELAQLTMDHGINSSPAWSPDGARIAYAGAREGEFVAGCWGSYLCPSDIHVIGIDGSGQVQLTDSPGDDSGPDWSSDGTRIAFVSARDDPDHRIHHIYVMNADGTEVTRLTQEPLWAHGAAWSPDGTRIAFVAWNQSESPPRATDVYVMNADGSGLVNLTNFGSDSNSFIQDLAWSPDGTRIAFTTDWEGPVNLFVMDADGSNLSPLTEGHRGAGDIAWRPVDA
jgi:Tol biopolymer transport system component